jgi:SagB-type dehydrogenase family enzyme
LNNWQPERAREYHESTKHWPGDALRRSVPASIIPHKYKLYEGLSATPLPSPARSDLPALSVLLDEPAGISAPLDLPRLAALLHFSAGVTRRVTRQGREIEFRAASCTGALYHIETYVVTGALADLDAGVYHFGVHDGALRQLRAGDFRAVIDSALCMPDSSEAQAYLVHTSTSWRNAWRYEDRAYRHAFWDTGTIIANLLALARAQGTSATLATAFRDGPVNELIGVDPRREAAVSIVAVGRGDPAGAAPPVEPLALPVVPLSPVEIEYPAITALHGRLPSRTARTSNAGAARSRTWPSQHQPRLTDSGQAPRFRPRCSPRRSRR